MTFSDADNDIKRGFFFLGTQSLGADTNSNLRCALHARVVAATSTFPRSLWLLTALSFLRRTDRCCLCTLLTARRICRMAADRTHDSTPAVDDGCAAIDSLRQSLSATPGRDASQISERWPGAVLSVRHVAEGWPLRHASRFLLDCVRFYEHRLAYAADVSTRTQLSTMARSRTLLLSH